MSSGFVYSQVGINTTTPSAAAVLDVSSSADGTNFGGIKLPRVTVDQRDLIPVTADDAGLIVYVNDGPINELQLWNGVVWVSAFTQTLEQNALIAAWEVFGLNNPTVPVSPFSPTSSNIGVSIGGLTLSPSLSFGTGFNAWGATNWFNMGVDMPQDAINAESFVTFTITPNSGAELSFTSIEPYNIRRSTTGPTTGLWQYSINGGAFFDIGSSITWGGTTSATGNAQVAIDLSGIPALQNLTSDSTVTFRIVNWGAGGSGGTWYINNHAAGEDLIIRGTIIQ